MCPCSTGLPKKSDHFRRVNGYNARKQRVYDKVTTPATAPLSLIATLQKSVDAAGPQSAL